MFQKVRKLIAFLCALALVITVIPVSAQAAVKPKFSKEYTGLYENGTSKGVYTYTVKKLTKGQKVKWSVSGTGKSYVKLQKTSVTATGSTVSNKLTVKTGGKTAAKNKTVVLTAKVYSKTGKLLYTLKSKTAKIKAKPTKIEIAEDTLWNGDLFVGETYQFQYKITPANATSSNVWSATDEDGKAVSCITKSGAFTPKKEGTYTITVQAKIGSKVIKSASKTVKVGKTMMDVSQIAANKVVAEYSSSVRDMVKKTDFTIRNASGTAVEVKEIEFSKDGSQVILTTSSLLKDGTEYLVTDGKMTYNFTAHVGKPVSLKILTTEVTVGKETPVEYALYDANGIDVQAAYPGTFKYDPKITNGYLTKENNIYMQSVGDVGTITMTYTCSSDKDLILTNTASFICVAVNMSSDTNFTITTSDSTPDYGAASYTDNRKVAAGGNYYLHFRALDEDKNEIKYDSISYESLDPDMLLINNKSNGIAKATAVKNGTVKVIVTAVYGQKEYTYSYDVTIAEPSHLESIVLDQNVLTMSNRGVYGYKGYINLEGRDQYGSEISLDDETAQITPNGNSVTNMATYDAINNRIVVDASYKSTGSYHYTLSLTMGKYKAAVSFTVVVQTPPERGTVTYQLEMDQPVIDLAMNGQMSTVEFTSAKTVGIRLAEYRGGIFYDYEYIQSASIMKDGLYYSSDLTQAGSSKAVIIPAGSQILVSTVNVSGNVCTKADTGVYAVELKFYPRNTSSSGLSTLGGYLEITDSQTVPEISVKSTVADTSCKTALELAKTCLEVKGTNGEIVSCVVTGTDKTGAEYAVGAGEAVNIKSVMVQTKSVLSDGKTVVSNYTIAVGKTLKNK